MSMSSRNSHVLPPEQWRTFAIWQYDRRPGPPIPALFEQQTEDLLETNPDAEKITLAWRNTLSQTRIQGEGLRLANI